MLIDNNFRYPAMLRLQNRQCVIIGGGQVAARKLSTLCQAGAKVTVVALEKAQKFSCTLIRESYKKDFLTNAFIVIAATDNVAINRQITAEAPCLCNNITEPELSNFTVPASFTEGNITVALATGGMPAFTRILKQRLQQVITPEIADFNEFLHKQRLVVQQIPSTPEQRTAFWRQTLTDHIVNLVAADNAAQAKENILDAISSFRTQSQNSSR